MTSDGLPADVSAAISRITSPTSASTDHLPGELGLLAAWWGSVGDGRPPRAAWIVGPSGHAAPAEPAGSAGSGPALSAGLSAADREIDAGASLVIPAFEAPDPIGARTVIAVLCRTEASAVAYQAPGMTDPEWMSLCARIRDRAAEVSALRASPLVLLDALGAGPLAFAAGVLLGASARRTPSLIDGTDALAAALVADRLSFRAREWWRSAASSPDPGRRAAAERIDLAPGLPLGLVAEDRSGAQATLAILGTLVEEPP